MLIVFEFIDIVGIVKGVFKGEGFGNKFFFYICQVDVICYVVCVFFDDNIIYVFGKVDLIDDIEMINFELIFVDMEIVEKWIMCVSKFVK